jgi:alcohol dehydrogenase class IV
MRFNEMGSKRVALITDKGLVNAGIVDQIKEVFELQGAPLAGVYDNIKADAQTSNINDCARWYREIAADGILAVGGGSVIDVAKSVKMMVAYKVLDIMDILHMGVQFCFRPLAKPTGIPHITLPTTAGTGSEASRAAVIMNDATSIKYTYMHGYIQSDFAFLDPDLTVSLPANITAWTGFDALSHAFEAFFFAGANAQSDALAIQSIRLIRKYLPRAVQDGKDLEARTHMLSASYMAIMSMGVGSVMAAPIHNCAHAVGALHHVSHGEGNAVFIPAVMRNFPVYYKPRVAMLNWVLGIDSKKKSEDEALKAAVSDIEKFQKECGINPKFNITLDKDGAGMMAMAILADPVGMFLPLPAEVINGCIADCFTLS